MKFLLMAPAAMLVLALASAAHACPGCSGPPIPPPPPPPPEACSDALPAKADAVAAQRAVGKNIVEAPAPLPAQPVPVTCACCDPANR